MRLEDVWAPLSEVEFQRELREMVADGAPRVFALCEELGERDDGYVRYWGMAFDDCAEIVAASGNSRAAYRSADSALAKLSRRRKLHLIWADHAA